MARKGRRRYVIYKPALALGEGYLTGVRERRAKKRLADMLTEIHNRWTDRLHTDEPEVKP